MTEDMMQERQTALAALGTRFTLPSLNPRVHTVFDDQVCSTAPGRNG